MGSFSGGSTCKQTSCQCRDGRDVGSISGSGRSPGRGHGYPLPYSCLENRMDRGAWRVMVHRVTKSWTQLSSSNLAAAAAAAAAAAWWPRSPAAEHSSASPRSSPGSLWGSTGRSRACFGPLCDIPTAVLLCCAKLLQSCRV